ncbi:MAG: DUF4860 domain-containing protein [Eggerthellaceae bacterium]|jgi:hypothetical protein|nr:DUF4860 domain-containing protein [Eggerthellaceae bacterium]MCH4221012.1 DUF4860 domain-containing protein [Eggerthellaceae bacterium]
MKIILPTSHIASMQSVDQRFESHSESVYLAFEVLAIVILLIALIVGVNAFRAVSSLQQEDANLRSSLDTIVNTVHMDDTAQSASIGNGPEGPSLVLTESTDTAAYETRIYNYQGAIVEEYAPSGTALSPDRATKLETNTLFNVDLSDNSSLITIHTDAGWATVALRSSQEAITQ